MNTDADLSSKPNSLNATVIAGGYCVGCGACAATENSPFKIVMTSSGSFTAIIDNDMTETEESQDACPFFDHGEDEDSLVPDELRKGSEHHDDIGSYRMLFAGYSNEGNFRQSGSSGGLTNWLVAELLKANLIDGVIHVKAVESPSPGAPLFEYGISRDAKNLSAGAKSKYYPIEISKIISLINGTPGRYAFIGVPCFVKAVRLLALKNDAIRDRIKYCIALFCGHLKSTSFAEHAAWQMGVKPIDLVGFDFRTKDPDQPANRYSVTATGIVNGENIVRTAPTSSLQGSDWGQGFFKLKACDFCDDIVGETADISMGDAWLPEYIQDSNGTNIVIVRNSELVNLITKAASENRITVLPSTVPEIHKSQESNYRHRREGLAYRLAKLDAAGSWHPKKRINPKIGAVSEARKRVLDLRSLLRDSSSDFFRAAKNVGRLDLFVGLIKPLQAEYEAALAAERSEVKIFDDLIVKTPRPTELSNTIRYYVARIRSEILRLKRRASQNRMHALILPPTIPGGLGDDALVCSTITSLRKKGFTKIGLFEYSPGYPLAFTEQPDEFFDVSKFMPPAPKKTALDILLSAHDYDYFFVLGADILDGYYSDIESYQRLTLANQAVQIGMKTTLLGFSYNDSPRPMALNALRELDGKARICARDPVSGSRLDSHLRNPTIRVADVAFLLSPQKVSDHKLLAWLAGVKKSHSTIYGINAIFTSNFFEDKSSDSQSRYIAFYLDLIKSIRAREPSAHFVFIPHDYRPNGIGEGPILEYLYSMLPLEIQSETYLLSEKYSASEIKWIAGELDFIVSSRMHLAIAAIGQGTPVFCFEYQGKFKGLFDLLGTPDLLSSMTNALSNPEKVIDTLMTNIGNRASIRKHFKNKLPEIKELSERNFALETS